MDARRSRNNSTQRLAEFRWLGCVLLAMFALIQAARGSVGLTTPPEPLRSHSTQLTRASAVCKPKMHALSISAAIAVPAWGEAELTLMSNPLQAPKDQFDGAKPFNAVRITFAAPNYVNGGDLPI